LRKEQIHWGALNILQSFLLNHALPIYLYRPIINALVTVLSSGYIVQAQQKAHEMLLTQFHPITGGNHQYQEMVIPSLIGSLRHNDTTRAEHAQEILAQAGPLVTPYLQDELKKSLSEIACRRVVRVLGTIHDVRALPDIMALLSHSSLPMQQEVAIALRRFAPESIIPLIDTVLSPQANDSLMERAANILQNIGKDPALRDTCIFSICDGLLRVTPYGIRYLVLVLKDLGDRRSVPSLITLLQKVAQTNVDLAGIIMQALGVFHDVRIIPPLIDVLARSGPPLSNQAIELLSSFGEQALGNLIARLDVKIDTVLADRIRSTLLQMQPFPREQLLEAFKFVTDAQAEHLVTVFLAKNAEVASFLVDRLLHSHPRVQQYVRRMVSDMPSNASIPPLIDALNRSGEWLPVLAGYLLKHQESIPYLVERLGDNARNQAAYTILFRFGEHVLPHLMLGLDNDKAQSRTRDLLVALVRQNQAILPLVVSLFDPGASNLPTLSVRMKKQLSSVLVQELSDICVPALLQGLEVHHLVEHASDVLAELARSPHQQEMVLRAVLEALHEISRRHGAEITLIKIGAPALPSLDNLMTHPESEIVQSVQSILREMGPIGLPLIVAAISDSTNHKRQEVALQIFNTMPTASIADSLVKGLSSENQHEVEMALVLLHLRIAKETGRTFETREIIPALLQKAQSTNSYQHILAALILLGEKTVSKKDIANYLADFLLKVPKQSHNVIHIFPLLGGQAIESLTKILDKTEPLSSLHREVAGTLGVISPHERVVEYVNDLARYVIPAHKTVQFNDPKRNLYLRALGGLLASGNLAGNELADLMRKSKASSEREFFEVLFGFRKLPEIESLTTKLEDVNRNLINEQAVSKERLDEIFRLRNKLDSTRTDKEYFEQESQKAHMSLVQARQRIADLEQQLRNMHR
jgi:HEAT repeat protein